MTDNNTDSTQLTAQAETPSKDAAKPSGESKPSSVPLILSAIALVLVIGALVGGYFVWHEVNRQADWQREVLAQIDTRNISMDERFKTFGSRLEADLASAKRGRERIEQGQQDLESTQSGLEQALGMLRSQVGRHQDEWVLAETRYLLHVANQRIELQRDRDTALAALLSADQRLLSLGESSYLPVRKKIADEVSQLRTIVIPDINGMALELQQLAESVHDLRMQGSHYVPTKPEELQVENESWRPESWRDVPDAFLGLFKEVFVLQPVDKPVGPMLPPESRFFIYSNLRLQLEAARLALLSQEVGAYQTSLQAAQAWLNDYFDTEHVATQSMKDRLSRLVQIDIKPEFPEISGSLKLLREEMRLAAVRDPAPVLADEKVTEQVVVEPVPEKLIEVEANDIEKTKVEEKPEGDPAPEQNKESAGVDEESSS